MQIFRDGTHVHLPDDPRRRPELLGTIPFDCFAPGNTDTGEFSEWLGHNSGAQFNDAGTAQLSYYLWNRFTSLAEKVGKYYQITEAGKSYYYESVFPEASTYFADKPVGHIGVFPFSTEFYEVAHRHESPSWVPQTTVDFDDPLPNPIFVWFDDVFASVGRARLVEHKAQYTIKKMAPFPPHAGASTFEVIQVRYTGVVEDLYDFIREAPGAGGHGAIVQIGHGNGGYGPARKAGVIFRDRIEFNVTIDDPDNIP